MDEVVYSLTPLCVQAPGDRAGCCMYLFSYLGGGDLYTRQALFVRVEMGRYIMAF